MEPNHQRPPLAIYILPNLLTTTNMFFGFMAIILAIKGSFLTSAYAIVAAAVFDLLDGRVARLTKTQSSFGAEYDSLCDLISFGMAPALLMYLWALQAFGRIGWLASFVFVACGALRLARFNVQKNVDTIDFQGLPIPMAAGIVASSVLCFYELDLDGTRNKLLLGITFLLGLTMVSEFRYRSFKELNLRKKQPFFYLVAGVIIIVLIAFHPEVMLFIMFLSYATMGALMGIFNYKNQKIRRQKAAQAQSEMTSSDKLPQREESKSKEKTSNKETSSANNISPKNNSNKSKVTNETRH